MNHLNPFLHIIGHCILGLIVYREWPSLGQAKYRWYVVNVLLKVETVSWEENVENNVNFSSKWGHLVEKNKPLKHISKLKSG